MGKISTPTIITAFREEGYYAPLRLYDRAEAHELYQSYAQFQEKAVEIFGTEQRFKTHLLAKWLANVVRDPRILDVIEGFIGPNILCWSTAFFAKSANSVGYVGHHQDAAINFIEPHSDIIHLWLALKPTTKENGCLRVLPHSHLDGVLPLSPSDDGQNVLLEGTQASLDATEGEFVDLILDAGEASLHHHRTVHGSGPNRSDTDRLGVSISYMPTTAHNPKRTDSATLVRGVDDFDNFEFEAAPESDFSEASITEFRRAITVPGGGG
jgi:non-heme Fe2+,alpha-ketoglutarate-dependent halogenase